MLHCAAWILGSRNDMLNAVRNNRLALTTLTRAAWFVIDTGQRIAALSGDFEGTEAYTVRSNFAWKLRTAGETLSVWGSDLRDTWMLGPLWQALALMIFSGR